MRAYFFWCLFFYSTFIKTSEPSGTRRTGTWTNYIPQFSERVRFLQALQAVYKKGLGINENDYRRIMANPYLSETLNKLNVVNEKVDELTSKYPEPQPINDEFRAMTAMTEYKIDDMRKSAVRLFHSLQYPSYKTVLIFENAETQFNPRQLNMEYLSNTFAFICQKMGREYSLKKSPKVEYFSILEMKSISYVYVSGKKKRAHWYGTCYFDILYVDVMLGHKDNMGTQYFFIALRFADVFIIVDHFVEVPVGRGKREFIFA